MALKEAGQFFVRPWMHVSQTGGSRKRNYIPFFEVSATRDQLVILSYPCCDI